MLLVGDSDDCTGTEYTFHGSHYRRSMHCGVRPLGMHLSDSQVSSIIGLFRRPLNRNSSYLENGRGDSNIRPWFWVLCFFLGPTTYTIFWEGYIFVSTRALVHTEAILTELVFEHSLRVRFTAESVSDEKADSQQAQGNLTIVDSVDNSSEAHGPAVSSTDSESTATTSTAGKGKSKTVAPTASSATSSTVNVTAPPTKSPKKDINLVGKINNFVTTDLSNIIRSKDFFFLRTSLQLTELPSHKSTHHLPPQS